MEFRFAKTLEVPLQVFLELGVVSHFWTVNLAAPFCIACNWKNRKSSPFILFFGRTFAPLPTLETWGFVPSFAWDIAHTPILLADDRIMTQQIWSIVMIETSAHVWNVLRLSKLACYSNVCKQTMRWQHETGETSWTIAHTHIWLYIYIHCIGMPLYSYLHDNISRYRIYLQH